MFFLRKKIYQNWSGLVRFQPKNYWEPRTENEIIAGVRKAAAAGRTIRVVGSAHSFTPLIQTNDELVSLKNYQGIISTDPLKKTAWIKAGTTLKKLGKDLFALGYSQENLGDINAQSLAGAVCTGTHGTGLQFGSISTQVTALKIVTAEGQVILCSENENSELFQAARLSLGALGLIIEIELKLIPALRLRAVTQVEKLSVCVDEFESRARKNRHFEFFWFPYSDQVMAKTINPTSDAKNSSFLHHLVMDLFLENVVFHLANVMGKWIPGWSEKLCQTLMKVAEMSGESIRVDSAYLVFPSVRLSKFYEMEYSIPIGHLKTVLNEIKNSMRTKNLNTTFPVEVRSVKADSILLSPAYERDSALIAVHAFKGTEYQTFFSEIESIFLSHEGRPHWGKMHTLKAADLSKRYPEFAQFQAAVQKLNPKKTFLNSYLTDLFF